MPTLEDIITDIRSGKLDVEVEGRTELEALSELDPEEMSDVLEALVDNSEELAEMLGDRYNFEDGQGVIKSFDGWTVGADPSHEEQDDLNPFMGVAVLYDLVSNYEGQGKGPGEDISLTESFEEVQSEEVLFNHLLYDVERFFDEKDDYPNDPSGLIDGSSEFRDIDESSHRDALMTRLERVGEYLENKGFERDPVEKTPGVAKAVEEVRETIQTVLDSSDLNKSDIDAYLHDQEYDGSASRLTLTYRNASTIPTTELGEEGREEVEDELEQAIDEFEDAEEFRRYVGQLSNMSELVPLQDSVPRNDHPTAALGRLRQYIYEHGEPLTEEGALVRMELEGDLLDAYSPQPSVGLGDLMHGGYIGSTHFIDGKRGEKNGFEGDTIIVDRDLVDEAFDQYVSMRQGDSEPIYFSDNYDRSDYKNERTSAGRATPKSPQKGTVVNVEADEAKFFFSN